MYNNMARFNAAKQRRGRKAKKSTRKGGKVSMRTNFARKVSAICTKVIRQDVETKVAYHTQTPTDFNSGITSAADVLRCIPNINKGDDENQRSGAELTPLSLNIRGIVQLLPQAPSQPAAYCKIAARMMLVSPKGYPNWASANTSTANWLPYIIKKGAVATQFTGAIDDLFAPANTDIITVHRQRYFYMSQGWSAGGVNGYMDQHNLVKFFQLNVKFGKGRKFLYDANVDGGLTPTNAGYFLVIGYCFVDGSSPDTLSTRLRLQYDSTLKYEDA